MKNINKGDIVTQDATFYKFWKCQKFKREVISIEGDIARLKDSITIIFYDGTISDKNFINLDYIKVDVSETRKQKLLKINDRI